MGKVNFVAMATDEARRYWNGESDSNGDAPELHVAEGPGIPCRHCLAEVSVGEEYLILGYRPFPSPQPYAEVGPVFLHAKACERYADVQTTPAMYLGGEDRLVKGYSHDDRIVYGTGRVVNPDDIQSYAQQLLQDPKIAYIHVRSSTNNCFSCRIDRNDMPE